jgi:hypothetical protein
VRACEDDVAYLCIESFLNISVNYFEIFLAALITDPERHDVIFLSRSSTGGGRT